MIAITAAIMLYIYLQLYLFCSNRLPLWVVIICEFGSISHSRILTLKLRFECLRFLNKTKCWIFVGWVLKAAQIFKSSRLVIIVYCGGKRRTGLRKFKIIAVEPFSPKPFNFSLCHFGQLFTFWVFLVEPKH